MREATKDSLVRWIGLRLNGFSVSEISNMESISESRINRLIAKAVANYKATSVIHLIGIMIKDGDIFTTSTDDGKRGLIAERNNLHEAVKRVNEILSKM